MYAKVEKERQNLIVTGNMLRMMATLGFVFIEMKN